MTIGNRIRNKRRELGLTQTELGNKMGVTKSSICKVENDVEQNLSMDRVKEYADALGVTPAYLMGWEDVEWNPSTQEISIPQYDFGVTKEEVELMTEVLKNEDSKRMLLSYVKKLHELINFDE